MGWITSAFGAIGAGQQAAAQRQMATIYNGQSINQRMVDNASAASATSAGAAAAGAVDVRGTQTIGAQQAGYASGGVDTQTGSALDTMADTRMMTALDAATIRNNAAKSAWGLKVKGMTDYQQGQLNALGASNKANADEDQLLGDSIAGGVGVASAAGSFYSGATTSPGGGALGDFSSPSSGGRYA